MEDKSKGKGVKKVASGTVENGTKLWKASGKQFVDFVGRA